VNLKSFGVHEEWNIMARVAIMTIRLLGVERLVHGQVEQAT
jgi:hypothetical protein